MTNFNKYQKITMGALVAALLFNPMVVEILDEYFKWAYSAISIAATVWCVGFLLFCTFKSGQVKTPKKKKSSVKNTDYIET